jgi:putative MATE family efflux protein
MLKRGIDLGRDAPLKIFIHYAVPAVLSMVAMILAYIIDGIFIGRYVGQHGLAAVNLTFPIFSFYSGVSVMVGTGGITLANIKRGENNRREANNLFTVTNAILLLFGLGSIALGMSSLETLLSFFDAEAETKQQLYDYLIILFPFFPAFMLTYSLDMFVRSDGKPTLAVLCVAGGSAINVALDYLLVARMGWGIKGAAYATGAAQLLPTGILSVYILIWSRWKLVIPRWRLRELAAMCYNGLSEMVNEFSIGIATLVFNIIILKRLGSMGVAAFSIALYISTIALAVYLGLSQAIHPGISFNLGARQLNRVHRLRNLGVGTSFGFSILLMAVIFYFREPMAALFAKDNTLLIRQSSEIIFFYNFAFLFMGVNICISLYFTAINRPAQSALISLWRSLLGVMAGLALLPLFLGDTGIWLSPFFAESITVILGAYYLWKHKIRLRQL